ncbi:MAG: AAA family ATPase [Desulfobulbaceae bacterium]|nr:MAG: AAA family ATPase [Desulfobulbaceae bacterium]
MKKNIVLIGFMGVGKGSTARKLAEMTGMYAVDCDDLIESLANMRIRKIFEVHGEEWFRKLERRTAKWLEDSVKETIISTGGGFYKVANLRKIGKIVYLHAEFDAIYERLTASDNAARKIEKRPLLKDIDKARRLHTERVPLYRRVADVEIDVMGSSQGEIAEQICRALMIKKKRADT